MKLTAPYRFLRTRLSQLLLATLLAAGTVAPTTGCSRNPATGDLQFNILSAEQEIAMGNQYAPQFKQEGGGEIPDTTIRNYVSELGHELAELSERPDLPWEFTVLDSEIVNAFALPGGKVFFTRGLLSKMNNEAQLVGVLGHEIGHVTAQHAGQQISRQLALAGIVAGIGYATEEDIWPILAGTGAQLYGLQYGRSHESQSDVLGVRYMVRAGYDPQALVQVMEIFKAEAGGSHPPEFLSTHPLPDTRINELQELIENEYAYTQNNANFVLNEQRYQQMVLDRLRRLPPPEDQQPADR
jgi:predicted Zn-dependent protease